ncbi:MAG: hypothetical protein PHW02_05915 [bacterium]|nr:hypothetical protein [bacterium]
MKNPVVYWELASHDRDKSAKFFKDVFEWDFDEDEKFGIFETKSGEGTMAGGGIFTLRRAKLPFLTIYIKVKDIHSMAKKVSENGGLIVLEPNEIAKGTMICLFNEPSGVTFGMLEKI